MKTEYSGKYVDAEKITYEEVDAFIQDVFVHDPKRIEIVFQFEDVLQEYCKHREKKAI